MVGRLPDGVDALHDDEHGRIVVSRDLLGEDPTALAALLAHEMTHALQVSIGEDLRRSCLDLEVDAVATEAYVWSTFWASDPPSRTDLAAGLTETSRIAATEGEAGCGGTSAGMGATLVSAAHPQILIRWPETSPVPAKDGSACGDSIRMTAPGLGSSSGLGRTPPCGGDVRSTRPRPAPARRCAPPGTLGA